LSVIVPTLNESENVDAVVEAILAQATAELDLGINRAKAEGVKFGPKPLLTDKVVERIKELRADGSTVPEIMRRTKLSKASVYRALGGD
jgi:DNA invertase Pin-like site-specific DNA recombinase